MLYTILEFVHCGETKRGCCIVLHTRVLLKSCCGLYRSIYDFGFHLPRTPAWNLSGQSPSILLRKTVRSLKKPHWGFHCSTSLHKREVVTLISARTILLKLQFSQTTYTFLHLDYKCLYLSNPIQTGEAHLYL